MDVDEAADLRVRSASNDHPAVSTIDLSVKRKSPEAQDPSTEGTLDLSQAGSGISSVPTGTNRRTQNLSFPHQIRPSTNENWSDSASPEVVMSDDDGTNQVTNGQVNGHGSCESDSRMDDDSMNDEEMPPSPKLKELTREELDLKERKLRLLKQELRNEEMKLVLLKKLKQSQMMKENLVNNIGIANAIPNAAPFVHAPNKMMTSLPTNKMVNSSVQNQFSHGKSQSRGQSVLNPPLSRHPAMAHAPPMIGPPSLGLNSHRSNAHNQHSHRPMMGSMTRTPVTTPPNVVLGYPVNELRAQTQNNHTTINAHSNSQVNDRKSKSNSDLTYFQLGMTTGGSPGPNNSEINQTPAQRQAAAKLALRKQLEKTLLQIPPPKPPPPEMHFIPNANNQEFIYYLGLETVVDFLTDSPNQNRPPPEPFECVQCGTDFTPVWKWQDRMDHDRDRPAVICESCVTSNIKKALKVEHTNRLKTAFVKALQQEQEIEQRIASGATSPPLPSMSPTPTQQSFTPAHQSVSSSVSLGSLSSTLGSSMSNSSQSLLPQAPPAHSSLSRLSSSAAASAAAAAAAVASSAALLQQMPKLSAAHQSLFAAQAQQLHQLAQSLPQPQPAHMLPFAPLLAAQYASYGMLGKSSANDLHRQYLLDMIPPRSLHQTTSNWKS